MGKGNRVGRNRYQGRLKEGQDPWSNINYKDILRKLGSPLPIWEYFFLRYIYSALIYININFLHLHPNTISLLSFLSALGGIYAFGTDQFMLGAILFELAFILDCVDGPVARITGQTSPLGVALEVWTDSTRLLGSIWAMVYALQDISLVIPASIYSVSFGAGIWIYTKSIESAMKGGAKINQWVASGPFWKVPTWIELETIGFFILPLLGKPLWGIYTLAIFHPLMTLVMTIHSVMYSEK